jgi:Recombination endonuclease VII
VKHCPDCGFDRPLDDFHKNPRNRDGRAGYCKEHACARTKAWCTANAERKRAVDKAYKQSERGREVGRASSYRTRYGLTMEQVEAMKATGCYICGSMDDLHIDHDHDTNEVRGVLCRRHNMLEGVLRSARSHGEIDDIMHYLDNPPGVAGTLNPWRVRIR